MGIDAPSTDLTARIQATRRRLVESGDVEPMRPGERPIAGRAPGSFRVEDAAPHHTGREHRVVEMDMTDYTGTQPGTKEALAAADADEPFDATEIEEVHAFDLGDGPTSIEDLLDDEDFAVLQDEQEPGPETFPEDEKEGGDLAMMILDINLADFGERLVRIEKAQDAYRAETAESLAGIAKGLTIMAAFIGDSLGRIEQAGPVAVLPPPLSRWQRFVRSF